MKNLNIQVLFLLFLIIVFCVGWYLHTFQLIKPDILKESMENDDKSADCPDMLINKGDTLLLYNSRKPQEDGVNPLPFFNLDEYINYLEIQRKKGIRCPVLYLQKENNAQGQDVFRIRPSPFQQEGGLPMTRAEFNHQDKQIDHPPTILYDNSANLDRNAPIPIIDANRERPPYNAGNYAGFDPYGIHQGTYTELDRIHDSTAKAQLSENPFDPNWGGVLYTQQMVDSGKYDDYNVTKPRYVTPKDTQIPNLYAGIPPPDDKAY